MHQSGSPVQQEQSQSGSNVVKAGKLAAVSLAAASFFGGEYAVAAEQNVDINRLAQKVAPANIRLVMQKEGSPAQGSATLVQTPEELKALLKPGEVLAVTAGHVCWDWNKNARVEAHVFREFNGTRPGSYTTHQGRVIHYYPAGTQPDVGLIAIKVDKPEELTIVPIAAEETKYDFGTYAITVGCPGGKDSIWKDARIISHTNATATTSGDVVGIAMVEGGHSGGGLYNSKGELIGICSGTRTVSPGTIDFMVPGVENIQASNEHEFKRKLSALTPDWAEFSRGRTSFTPVQGLHNLVDEVAAGYTRAVEQLEKLEKSCQRVQEKVWEATENLPDEERDQVRAHFTTITERALEAARKDIKKYTE